MLRRVRPRPPFPAPVVVSTLPHPRLIIIAASRSRSQRENAATCFRNAVGPAINSVRPGARTGTGGRATVAHNVRGASSLARKPAMRRRRLARRQRPTGRTLRVVGICTAPPRRLLSGRRASHSPWAGRRARRCHAGAAGGGRRLATSTRAGTPRASIARRQGFAIMVGEWG